MRRRRSPADPVLSGAGGSGPEGLAVDVLAPTGPPVAYPHDLAPTGEPAARTAPMPVPGRAGQAVIELVGVSKVYASGSLRVEALRSVSLRVADGEFVAVIGPSGSGKSTLMHILGCLDIPSSGVFRLAGEDVASLGEDQLALVRNRSIGFVFQQFNLLPYLTAWRNVELPLVYAGVDPADRRALALDALAQVGLADRADHRPTELSGGQQQRVAVARALVTQPALVLADEPTGNLDSVSSADVLALLRRLHASGRTIVLITHDAEVAARASRVVQIRDGQLSETTSVTVGADRDGGTGDEVPR
jgi:putative ABC transport system ATP-binding protein